MLRKLSWLVVVFIMGSLMANPAALAQNAAWEQKWDKLVEAAKSEGVVRIYSVLASGTRNELSKGFTAKYGIKVEFVVGRGSELAPKIFAERKSGLYLVDGLSAGSGTQLVRMKPRKIQERLDSLLILPEVTDPKVWVGGQIPYLDKDHLAIGLAAMKNTYLGRNTNLVKEGEVKSFMDVLDPKWKGKIVMHDLSFTGAANTWGSFMIKDILGSEERFRQYLIDLKKNQPFITRDTRMVVESMARGKYALAIGPNPENMIDFLDIGSPVAVITAVEGAQITAGAASYSVLKNAAHPNASVVFLNWLLSREGATHFSRGIGAPSARKDVQVVKVHPSYKLNPDDKLFPEVEEGILLKRNVIKLAKEVFGLKGRTKKKK